MADPRTLDRFNRGEPLPAAGLSGGLTLDRFNRGEPFAYGLPVFQHASVVVPLSTLTVTGRAPTVTAGVKATSPAGTVTVRGWAPSLSVSASLVVGAGTITGTGKTPVVTAGASLTAPKGTITVGGTAPTVEVLRYLRLRVKREV